MSGDERLALRAIGEQTFLLVGAEMCRRRRDKFQRRETGCLNTPLLGLDSLPGLSVNKGCLSGQPVVDDFGAILMTELTRRAEHGENLHLWIGKKTASSDQNGRETSLSNFLLFERSGWTFGVVPTT